MDASQPHHQGSGFVETAAGARCPDARGIRRLVDELPLRVRAMVILEGSTGLRRSELVALTWRDVDPLLMQVNVLRSCVRGRFGDIKTDASRKPVPLHTSVIECLNVWRKESLYNGEDDFLFPSIRNEGRTPVTPDMILKKIIRPAIVRRRSPTRQSDGTASVTLWRRT